MAYRVVIAEDFKMVREVFENAVKQSGRYELAAAFATAEEAAEYLKKRPADLVILDVLFPGGMSGLAAARRIRKSSP